MCTIIDPLFIFLHLFEKFASKSFVNFQDIITQAKEEFPDFQNFRNGEEKLDFSKICTSQNIMDTVYWKISEEKVISWLSCKFDKLKTKLTSINFTEKSEVSSFVLVSKEKDTEGK